MRDLNNNVVDGGSSVNIDVVVLRNIMRRGGRILDVGFRAGVEKSCKECKWYIEISNPEPSRSCLVWYAFDKISNVL